MVKIQYASDLHLEFMENTLYLETHPLQPVADILVLAGDTGYLGDEGFVKHPFWDWASENFKQVIVIPGNHEFYLGYDLGQLHDGWCMEIRHNIKCYYNAVIHLSDDTDLIVSTLWGHIEAQDAFATERSVNDFYRIKDNGVVISCEQFNKEHDKCRAFIEKAVGASKAKHIVVATHHVPSFELVSPDFMGSSINGAFTAELGNFIAYSHIDYWIYGHSHRNIDKMIGQTKCISNQLGYVSHGEAKAFDFMKCINL